MCGIIGIYHADTQRSVNASLVRAATDAMFHRGPDDDGVFVSGNVGLGHRRLSIIDLSSGHQPMFNEDNRIALVYNGEIYNFKEIAAELIAAGHVFRTHCDTEVIIHAYEQWGTGCVQRFIGMFAFALWDSRKNKLWVCRDRLGIKPLYYAWDGNTLVCASEVKALLATGMVKTGINERVLDAYFSVGYVPGPDTMFSGIIKLQPGHFMELSGRDMKITQYWDFADTAPSDITFKEAERRFDELLHDSVNRRLMSDVPLGVFLSGGLDSSAVVSVMNDVVKDPINTFTVSYDKKYDVGEDAYARIIADTYHTIHHVFQLEPDDFLASVDTLVHFSEEPIVESAAIALFHISKLARQKAIVLLSGEGSDEILGGYYLYRFMHMLEKAHNAIPSPLIAAAGVLGRAAGSARYMKYLDWMGMPLEDRYRGTSSYLTPSLKRLLYAPGFTPGAYLDDVFHGYFAKVAHKNDTINKLLYVDTKTWLADDLLVKADKMTMAASIELRVPFLDHRLVEFASSLPSAFKVAKGQGKYLLKSVMQDRLPREIVFRKKMGFPVPEKSWFGGRLFTAVKARLLDNGGVLPWIDRSRLEAMLAAHQAGRENHSKMIMMLLVLVAWQDRYNKKVV